jgi:hypothetical protein
MGILVTCPSCKDSLNVKAEFAGKTGKCPKCGASVKVPQEPSSGSPRSSQPDAKKGIPPATERQKEYARSLGIQFDENVDRKTISKLIDEAVQRQTDERYQVLDDLQDKESAAYQKMREEVLQEIDAEDTRLSKATEDQIVEELGQREMGAILITFDIDALDAIEEGSSANARVFFCEDLSEDDARQVLGMIAVSMMKE